MSPPTHNSDDHSPGPPPGSLHTPQAHHDPPPDLQTWAALLAHWVDFARTGVALPPTNEGVRWKSAIAPIISLQAVTHALADLPALPAAERALALDRAALLVRDNAGALTRLWGADPLPDSLLELIADAGAARDAATTLGRHYLVAEPRLVMASLDALLESLGEARFTGDLRAALPGSILVEGEPALFVAPDAPTPISIPGLRAEARVAPALQVYRQIDPDSGRVSADLIAPLHGALPAGRPMLVTLIDAGAPTDALRAHDAESWQMLQESLLPHAPIPVTRHAEARARHPLP